MYQLKIILIASGSKKKTGNTRFLQRYYVLLRYSKNADFKQDKLVIESHVTHTNTIILILSLILIY